MNEFLIILTVVLGLMVLSLMPPETPQPRYIHVKHKGVWVDTQASNLNAMNGGH